ncbi:hypothetical protein DAEQUDRAFT_545058 [Daedalea quercina L-15889]|uniref:Zn(2)-C6 fungal-type domain-containing protein n=1 Tax=Daedalea quercina L-15889 TaxID=1314783 RepID=A0A165T0R6_9APHY|nr:hypothetical protein DAEQUDRAFT_545058 [Daedalea quercina L-15889]
MPKASSSSARPSLRRNQACLACRKRKLKCDAARPHCGTCVKQWQALISVPPPVGYAHPTEPTCSYDPVEGLAVAPELDSAERIRQLEDQIVQLKSQLRSQQHSFPSGSVSPPTTAQFSTRYPTGSGSLSVSSGRSSAGSPNVSAMAVASVHPPLDYGNGLSTHSPDSQSRSSAGSPEMTRPGSGPDPLMDVLCAGWDPHLPEPPVLNHYVDVFFRCDPCSTRMFDRPAFLASLHLNPRDPKFPHSAILHAICASASRHASSEIVIQPDGTRRDRFAEVHVSKTREYIDSTMATGQDIFPVMQACSILSWYFYQEGRWVEVWIFAGFQTRVAVPLGLNYPGTFSHQTNNAPGAYLPPPSDFKDLETRRRTWWMTIMFDRIVSVGGWLHAIDEKDIGTEFPVRAEDFESDSGVPNNPQNLATRDVFIRHQPQYTDSFLLFLKAIMLFGRVTDFNTRNRLRHGLPSKNQNPFQVSGFHELDQLVCMDFLESFPPPFKHLEIGGDAANFDSDLYMARIAPYAAMITLHNNFIDFSNEQSVSTMRCIHATRAILNALHKLSETSLDTTRLHPFIVICWYLAAVVQVQLCKYFIEIGDSSRESTVWGEINALRFAMIAYGTRSPIGTRQERLLQGVMQEIIRLTNQPEPLASGVRLYPFSHASLFSKAATSQNEVPAPIPGVRSFELGAALADAAMPPMAAVQAALQEADSAAAVAAHMSELLPLPAAGQRHGGGGAAVLGWSATRTAAPGLVGMSMNVNVDVNESHLAHMQHGVLPGMAAHGMHPRPAILSGTSYGGGF